VAFGQALLGVVPSPGWAFGTVYRRLHRLGVHYDAQTGCFGEALDVADLRAREISSAIALGRHGSSPATSITSDELATARPGARPLSCCVPCVLSLTARPGHTGPP